MTTFSRALVAVSFLLTSAVLQAAADEGHPPNILLVMVDDVGWGSASAGPLDLFKMTIAEGGIRSPLLIAGPGVEDGGQVNEFAFIWDIMPTLLDFADIEAPEKYQGRQVASMRGRSPRGVLDGSQQAVYGAREFIGGEMQNGKWMRQGDYKALSVAPPYEDGITWQMIRAKSVTLPLYNRKY